MNRDREILASPKNNSKGKILGSTNLRSKSKGQDFSGVANSISRKVTECDDVHQRGDDALAFGDVACSGAMDASSSQGSTTEPGLMPSR